MRLPRTPDILHDVIDGCTKEELAAKPAPDRFSIAEVIAHLNHTESQHYGCRLQQLTAESDPVWTSYDTDAFVAAGTYSGHDARVELTQYEIARRKNLELLAGVDLGREVRHARYGKVTVENLLAEWGCHDLAHVRQVAELVRWVRYAEHLGPWGPLYTITP